VGQALSLRDTLAASAALLVRSFLGEEIRLRELRQSTRDVEAWVLYQRAERVRKEMDSLGAADDTAGVSRAWAASDSLLAEAERQDSRWVDPVTLRGALAYRRSRAAVDQPALAGRWIEAGLRHVARALALQARNPDALELRGNLRYWKWLLGLEPDAARARGLLDSARADLELAVSINGSQAGAWATLSHLYNQTGSGVDVNLAARRALEADAFLSNADVILTRLFFSSYDLGQFVDARRWCDEGIRRFPANYRFTECRLLMLTTRDEQPDAARAWVLADSLLALTPPALRDYQRLSTQLMVAAVLARAGLTDSARALAARSRGDEVTDPTRDLANIAAFVYRLAGDTAAAIDQLKLYVAANPAKRATLRDDPGWWFRDIASTPAFRQLVAGDR
jgi:serine/threonine-protein kinase